MLIEHKESFFDVVKVGENLKRLRESKSLSLEDLVGVVLHGKVSIRVLSSWENGDQLIPLEYLVKVCNYFNIRLSSILVFKNKYRHLSNILI